MGRWILLLVISTLILIAQTQQHFAIPEQGSGGDESGDHPTDESDEWDIEGSGVLDNELTECQRQQKHVPESSNTFRPDCTPDGKFKPMQCDNSTQQCWCVNKDGKEVVGSGQRYPDKPKCTKKPVPFVPTRKPNKELPGDLSGTTIIKSTPSDTDTDIVIVESSTMEPEKPTDRKTPRILTTIGTSDYEEEDSDKTIATQKPSPFAFLFNDPLILAGILGGAVLALLCVVLLVMFTIYRMRKKDEGSYALDEPKKSYGFAYTRAKDQEFFA